MTFIGWTAFQLVTALSVLALGVVIGGVWEARMKTRSKNRIRRWDDDPKVVSAQQPTGTSSAKQCLRHDTALKQHQRPSLW
jgi:hypothetical protein